MLRIVLPVAALLTAALLLSRWIDRERPPSSEELAETCRVLRVIDGDTLDADCHAGRQRIRLLRIDTPEREEPGYGEARSALSQMVTGHEIRLVYEEPGQPQRGNHGRLLAYVYANDKNVCIEMVRQGWSPFWTAFGEGRFAASFRRAEAEARREQRGLWRP